MPVMPCGCVNVHQDSLHGEGKRVFNRTGKKDVKEYRCTVCGSVKSKGGDGDTKKKKK